MKTKEIIRTLTSSPNQIKDSIYNNMTSNYEVVIYLYIVKKLSLQPGGFKFNSIYLSKHIKFKPHLINEAIKGISKYFKYQASKDNPNEHRFYKEIATVPESTLVRSYNRLLRPDTSMPKTFSSMETKLQEIQEVINVISRDISKSKHTMVKLSKEVMYFMINTNMGNLKAMRLLRLITQSPNDRIVILNFKSIERILGHSNIDKKKIVDLFESFKINGILESYKTDKKSIHFYKKDIDSLNVPYAIWTNVNKYTDIKPLF